MTQKVHGTGSSAQNNDTTANLLPRRHHDSMYSTEVILFSEKVSAAELQNRPICYAAHQVCAMTSVNKQWRFVTSAAGEIGMLRGRSTLKSVRFWEVEGCLQEKRPKRVK